jgi:di/tricarboxylate transporter
MISDLMTIMPLLALGLDLTDPQKQALVFVVLGAVIYALVYLRSSPDLVLLGGLTILLVAGVVDPREALAGFGNEGLITVAVLFVVAEGLRQTGGITVIGQKLLGQPSSVRAAQLRIMLPTALMSAFMNNTPVVAMALPLIGDWARRVRLSVTHLLLPLSYAAILGGLCTLVGTSTTLVVNGLLLDEPGADKLGMFDIAQVGVPVMIVGLIYLLVTTVWLLPERKPAFTQQEDPREYTVEMIVDPGSPLTGKTIEEAGLRHLPGMYLMEIDRDGHVLAAVASSERLQGNDRLIFVGVVESVVDLQKIPGLKPAIDHSFQLKGPRSERCLIEAVVSNSCPFIRTTIRDARFRSRYNAAVIAVARNGQRVRKKIGDIELLAGDTLLLETHPSFVETQRNNRDFFLVSRVEDSNPPRHERAWPARLILIGMVATVTTGLLSMLEAGMLAAGLMIVTRCVSGAEARRAVDWSVLLTIAAGLGIGAAMKQSGAAELVANGFTGLAGNNKHAVLAIVYAMTMIFTNLITAKAAAVLFFPIAMAAADKLDCSVMPFAIVVMIAAAASFATPIGYQTNLMVYGPGGYRFSDYLRIGAPLSLIAGVITVVLTPLIWPF